MMNPAEAKAVFKYIKENFCDNEKLCKGLRAVKEKISADRKNCSIFRKLELSSVLVKCLMNSDECVMKWTLSVFTSCLLEKEFQMEVHNTAGIPLLVSVLKTSKCQAIQQRVCKVIGQQCTYESSCSAFHSLNVCGLVVSFLKESETDLEKETAVKTLRCLGNSVSHQKLILKENGLFHVCQCILSTCSELREEALKTILHFVKWPNTAYLRQLLKGTDNFQHLRKLYELHEDMKKPVFKILLTVFSHHSSYSSIVEYKTNCEVLDYLCMAKLPFMIVSELQLEQGQEQEKKDEFKLILALCKFCELNKQWKKFSFNVLPTYHEKTWMQLTDCSGIALLVSLLSAKRKNLTLMQALFRGLLGVEYLHSLRVKVLYYCLEAKLLPLLADIFDDALKETCDIVDKDFQREACHHFSSEMESKKKSFDKEVPREILDWITSSEMTSSNHGSTKVLSSLYSSANDSRSRNSSSIEYRQINNFKFGTGKRAFRLSDEKRKRHRNFPETSFELQINSSSVTFKEDSKETEKKEGGEIHGKTRQGVSEDTQMWMDILEYIVRFLYQVISVKEDITSICKLFLLKCYQYMSKAWFVHSSALKLLVAIAKNPSSIQPVLDILFIPKLAVDLVHENFPKDCSQCALINSGINDFLLKLQDFFNHHHQYGQCEIANRLHPSKLDCVKHSCLVALTHVVKCPKLLKSFLLDHRGLKSLLLIFSSSDTDSKMRLYGIASLSTITFRLMVEHSKRRNTCLFCDANHKATTNHLDLEKKEKKKQLLILTSPKCNPTFNNITHKCNLEEEENKNCSFQFSNRLISANREKLSMSNEVLKGMLQGSFSESLEKCVQIKDVNSASMEMVIHFIYGCTCGVFYCQDAAVYIELLFIAEMYFIPELQILAVHHLALLLDPEDIYPFIESRIEIFEEGFLSHLICSLISKPMAIHLKKKWVDQLLTSSLKDVFIDQVSIGLTRLLTITSPICNCDSFRSYV